MNKNKELAQRYEDCIEAIRKQFEEAKNKYLNARNNSHKRKKNFENICLGIVNHTSFAFAVNEEHVKRIMEITDTKGELNTFQIVSNINKYQ